jgi:hypothetical protein
MITENKGRIVIETENEEGWKNLRQDVLPL